MTKIEAVARAIENAYIKKHPRWFKHCPKNHFINPFIYAKAAIKACDAWERRRRK